MYTEEQLNTFSKEELVQEVLALQSKVSEVNRLRDAVINLGDKIDEQRTRINICKANIYSMQKTLEDKKEERNYGI